MISTEERLRAAAQAAARTIPDGSAPPLRLPAELPLRPARRPRWLRAGWRRVVAPIAAAVAVVGVAAVSVTVSQLDRGQAGGPASTPASPISRAAALASVPPYYAGLTGYPGQPHLTVVIRALATGRALATVAVPAPFTSFTRISGAADDRTFVLSAVGPRPGGGHEVAFFRLRFDPGGPAPRLTRLPVLAVSGSDKVLGPGLGGLAVSPDGRQLAFVVLRPPPLPPQLRVAGLTTGTERTWVWNGPGWLADNGQTVSPVAWAADSRTLAFQQGHGFTSTSVRLLDTTRAGGDLRAASRLAAAWQFAEDRTGNIALSPDAGTVISPVTVVSGGVSELMISEFSAATGRVREQAAHWRYAGTAGGQDVLWAGPGGRVLIVVGPAASPLSGRLLHDPPWAVGVLTGGTFTPLPHADAHYTDWIAF